MLKMITLSGWGQPHDALSNLYPDAMSVDYARQPTTEDALDDIACHNPETIIGWSLGGQLAARAMATGRIKPKRLVLLAAPFQFVKNAAIPVGMPKDLFAKFRDNYLHNPLRTLSKAWELIEKDDSNAVTVQNELKKQDKSAVIAQNWLTWLDILEGFSCKDLDFTFFPPTLVIHGDQDKVVYPEQSLQFTQRLPQAKSILIPGCGHAPHWHDPHIVRKAIQDFI